MAVTQQSVSLTSDTLREIQDELRRQGLAGWLLYDFHGLNPVALGIVGLPALSRRFFVLVPARGEPVALTHAIEQQPWRGWIGTKRVYGSWRELEAQLAEMLAGVGRVAMEYDQGDAVPYVDRVPAGVIEMVRTAGAEPVSSADLVSAFYSRWSAAGEASHREAAAAVRETALAAFSRVGELLTSGEPVAEYPLRNWIVGELERRGLSVGAGTIVAVGPNAANPHYAPTAENSAPIRPGDLLLIDLWGKQNEDAIYADQTWMGYVGANPPERLRQVWEAVRDAREAACDLARSRWAAGQPVAGYELDDAARAVITARGYGPNFIHRTGHSIDRELHGSGPNIDNLETRDTRRLIRGIGFSVEPGVYLPGDVGFRSEVNMYVGPDGPEVTTPHPQQDLILVPAPDA